MRALVLKMLGLLALLAVAASVTGAAQAQGRRIALLIGNSGYSAKVGPLKNPANDIEGVRAALVAAGFRSEDIRLVPNATRLTLKREVDAFAGRAASLSSADVAFFYYSGHGAWRPGARSMSLIPVDAADATSDDFWYSTVNLDDEVLRTFTASRSLAAWIIAIDACRNELRLPTKDIGGSGDKAFQAMPSQAGMLISFAADEGQTARDLASGAAYSPYAAALIERLGHPGETASSVFSGVRPAVMRFTSGAQQPVLTNKLNVDPILNVAPASRPALGPTAPVAAPIEPPAIAPAQSLAASPPPAASFVDARSAASTTRAPLISVDLKTLPDFALFRECDGCPEMVVFPAGSFAMGSDDGFEQEKPVHQVTLRRFAISRFETTWDEWDACVAAGACNAAGPQGEGGDQGWGKGRHPVINVDWNDARAFAGFATRRTSATYRLPSEAEWEYAARAGTTGTYAWGPTASHDYANYGKDTCCDGLASGRDVWVNTAPVGAFPSNALGLFDMHGNAWEWVEDCFEGNYMAGQPSDGTAFTYGSCSTHVFRGGSWNDTPRRVSSANRTGGPPTLRTNDLGFRLARTL